MPKQKITKEMVIDAAFALARTGGMEQVRVKNIAKALNSSVQPIYSYCTNMEGLREAVARRVRQFVKAYIGARLNGADLFQSTGRAYIALAQEEPHILKIFLLQKRRGIASLEALYREEADPKIAQSIAREQSISEEKARKLHLDMLIYTMGIGTILAVSEPGIPIEEIYAQQERAYRIFLQGAQEEEL